MILIKKCSDIHCIFLNFFQKIAHKKIETIKMIIITSELSLKTKKLFGFTLMIIVESVEDKNIDTINLTFSIPSMTIGKHSLGSTK